MSPQSGWGDLSLRVRTKKSLVSSQSCRIFIVYESVRDSLGENWKALDRNSEKQSSDLLKQGYPEDYVQFLHEIGGPCDFGIYLYSGPTEATEIYPKPLHKTLESIVLFGDDGQGYCLGFDRETGMKLVEIDPRGEVLPLSEASFREWIDKVIRANH